MAEAPIEIRNVLAGSEAEAVYQRLGWQRAGQIPRYAADPWGKLFATVYFYKDFQ